MPLGRDPEPSDGRARAAALDLSAEGECCAMMAPLAVYVTRTRTGAFKEAHISNRPPEGAEVHLRTHDPDEARAIAARLRITLAPGFDAEASRERPYYPHTGPNGRPRKGRAGSTLAV